MLGGLKNRITGLGSIADLTTLKLSQLINNRAAVIIVVDAKIQGGGRVDISRFASQGFFIRKQFPLYNVYSDTNDQSDMIVDQLQKMKTYAAPSSSSSLFLLSWTFTQGITAAHRPERRERQLGVDTPSLARPHA